MKNILLVLQREYLTRVRKKSFIIMTLLGPLLIGAFYGAIIWAAIGSVNLKKVQILDESGLFKNRFKNTEELQYNYLEGSLDEAKKSFKNSNYDALAFIPKDIMQQPKSVKIFAEKGVPLDLKSRIEGNIEKEIENIKLTEAGITQKVLQDAKMNVSSETISLSDEGEKSSSSGAATIIGYLCSFLIYLSVLMFGVQVMRGVMEEKTSRIVEVIISSIKPFELLMGKIIGVALVGLTQFSLWILLSFGIMTVAGSALKSRIETTQTIMKQNQMQNMPPEMQAQMQSQQDKLPDNAISKGLKALETLPVWTIVGCFIFYFLGGYLLYSALFGAVGSAVDSETDTQQFMFPLTMPLIFSFAIAQFVIRDPDGSLAFWASMVPLTSPIVMMVRIPFGVPAWQVALSMVLLVGGFIFTTWIAARIYRVGILMYGKKVSFKELGKWIFYKS